jgi:hypothetical protein
MESRAAMDFHLSNLYQILFTIVEHLKYENFRLIVSLKFITFQKIIASVRIGPAQISDVKIRNYRPNYTAGLCSFNWNYVPLDHIIFRIYESSRFKCNI